MKTQIRSEAGSAYVITLLALVVLTILALSLALVTQTEVQVGSNERTVEPDVLLRRFRPRDVAWRKPCWSTTTPTTRRCPAPGRCC